MRPLMKAGACFILALGCAAQSGADTALTGDRPTKHYEWRASTFDRSEQAEAALDVDPQGNIVAVWSSRRQQAGTYGVYAQRFTPDGVALGGETCVNLWTQSHQSAPAIAIDGQGRTWTVWQSHGQDGYAGAIMARQFDANFVGGSELAVNQEWRGHQSNPVVAVSPSGTAVIVWTSLASPDSPSQVRARAFDRNGCPLTDEFAVSTQPARYETTPSGAIQPDGSFAVVFAAFDERMEPTGIRMQRFNAAGQGIGAEIVVSRPDTKSPIEPMIAATPGGYVVAWLDAESDGDDYGVVARRFDARGRPLGAAFVVNTTTAGPQNAAAIGVARDGRVAIAWNSDDGNHEGVFAQLFASAGARMGQELRFTIRTQGTQALRPAAGTRRLAFGPNGELIGVWSGDGGLGDESGVHVTMITPSPVEQSRDREGADLAARPRGITPDMRPAEPLLALADGPTPHEPPTFDPKTIDHAEREIELRGPDIGFTGIVNTGWTPPDPHLAVGPDQIVVMTNGAIAFFEKDGTKTFEDEIEGSFGFWGGLGTTGFVFDPEVLYDELSGRFFAMAAEAEDYPNGDQSFALVAVSDDSDPNGTWYKYRFETTSLAGYLFDSPNIGVDEDAVYITGDGFGLGANYPVFIYDKVSLLVGNPPAITKSLTLSTSTQSAGIPPVSFDNPPALYLIEHRENASNTSVRLIALRNPLGSPYFTTTTLTVPSYGPPEDPPQKGTSVRPETFDARFWNVAYRNGSLWATHHVNSSRVRARWYQIAMNGWPESGDSPTLVQSGEIDFGSDIRTYFCAITVDENGAAAMTYARSSPNEYISMGTAYRYAGEPAGTFPHTTTWQTSSGPYATSRWGDYGAVNVDPADPRTFWAHHEYAVSGSWRTWIAGFTPPYAVGDMNCDGLVNSGDIPGFVAAIIDPAGYAATYPACDGDLADVNDDGLVNSGDIPAFVDLLTK